MNQPLQFSSGNRSGKANRILFLVDHKHRDLPGLSLISHYLHQWGYEPRLVAAWQEEPVIDEFDPGFIVLNKPVYDEKRMLRWRTEGRLLIVIDTEGASQHIHHKMKITIPPDLFLFWSEREKEKYVQDLPAGSLAVAGCPRLDFMHPDWMWLYPERHELLQRVGLPRDRLTITFATSTQDTHFDEGYAKGKGQLRHRILSETPRYTDIVANMRHMRDISVKMLSCIATRYTDINFLIKPHPNENVIFWQELIRELPHRENFRLFAGRTINEMLRVSDLHIAHNACTTTFEALLAKIPVAEIQTEMSRRILHEDHLNLPTYVASSAEDICAVIETEIYGRGSRCDKSDNLETYIYKYYHKFDGNRCADYAQMLSKFMLDREGQVGVRRPVWLEPRLYGLGARQFYSNVRRSLSRTFRPVVDVKPAGEHMIDALGRFDNRMKPGDEEAWIGKFRQAGVGVPAPATSLSSASR